MTVHAYTKNGRRYWTVGPDKSHRDPSINEFNCYVECEFANHVGAFKHRMTHAEVFRVPVTAESKVKEELHLPADDPLKWALDFVGEFRQGVTNEEEQVKSAKRQTEVVVDEINALADSLSEIANRNHKEEK